MKYDKIRGSSIAEMMMQLRSQYGQTVYIIQTKEIRQGGLFGSDILAKKQYEIEYMVSEGDAPYGKPKGPQRSLSGDVRRVPLQRALSQAIPSLPSENKSDSPSPRPSEGVKAASSKPLETNLNDLDALIDSLKALKSRTASDLRTEPMKPEARMDRSGASEEIGDRSVPLVKAHPELAPPGIAEMPTREELEALFGPADEPAKPSGIWVSEEKEGEKNPLARIRDRLFENQASPQFVERFLAKLERSLSEEDRLHPNKVRSRSVEKMKDMIRVTPLIEREHGERKVIFLVGPNGSGKTTSLAKLAYRYQLEDGPSMSLYSLDLHRVAATEQLKTYAAVLQVPFFSPLFESDFREFLDRDGSQLIFVDTSGMGLRNSDRREELVRFIECVQDSVEVHLVLPVSLSPSLTEKYMEFFDPTGFEKILLTRLDEADFLANFIEAADKWKRPFSFLNNSPEVSSPMMTAGPEELARMVLGLSG